ncbi:MAG: hypothetical protein ACRDGG_08305 [Anaerolineae bacterium]
MLKALRTELLILLIVFLLGTLFGWIVLGWGIAPVEWKNAAPVDLQPSYRAFYLRTLAYAYADGAVTPDELTTLGIGERWPTTDLVAQVNQLAAEPGSGSRYQALLSALNATQSQSGAQAPAGSTGGSVSITGGLLPIVGVALAVVVVAFVSLQLVRRVSQSAQSQAVPGPGASRPASKSQAMVRSAQPTAWVDEVATPLKQFDMTYLLGDDRFDMSNAIETEQGTFLGECGMGISETIGVGDPDKVTAFEVWLFDKNDIRTVTTVLMSEHAFHDATLRAKLAPKGEAALAQNYAVVTLETAALRIRAKVMELEYGSGGLPDKSFFQKLHVVMAAWQIGDGGVTQPVPAY